MGKNCIFKQCFIGRQVVSAQGTGISIHNFPKDPSTLQLWTDVVRLQNADPEWTPTKFSFVCSMHFSSEDFIYSSVDTNRRRNNRRASGFLSRKRLLPQATPCVFPSKEEYHARKLDCQMALKLQQKAKKKKKKEELDVDSTTSAEETVAFVIDEPQQEDSMEFESEEDLENELEKCPHKPPGEGKSNVKEEEEKDCDFNLNNGVEQKHKGFKRKKTTVARNKVPRQSGSKAREKIAATTQYLEEEEGWEAEDNLQMEDFLETKLENVGPSEKKRSKMAAVLKAAKKRYSTVANLDELRAWLDEQEEILHEDVKAIDKGDKVILVVLDIDALDRLGVKYALTLKPDLGFSLECNGKALSPETVRYITRHERIWTTAHILRILAFLECYKDDFREDDDVSEKNRVQESSFAPSLRARLSGPSATDPVTLLRHLRATSLQQRPSLLQRPFRSQTLEQEPNQLSVLQWNTLAMALSRPGGDHACPPDVLHWPSRRAMILEEIVGRDADLVALQEVDSFQFFAQQLTPLGYTGHFSPKPKSPCVRVAGNIGPDGCAVFYKTSRFEELGQGTRVLGRRKGSMCGSTLLWVRLRDKLPLSSGPVAEPEITLMTTQLRDLENCKSKEQMVVDLIRAAEDIVDGSKSDDDGVDFPSSLLLCADFNCEPQAEPCQLIQQLFEPKLESAYEDLLAEPDLYTTVRADGERRCLDYIWYSPDSLRLKQVLAMPDENELPEEGLPSLNYPSAHLSLVAKFRYNYQ